MFCRSRCTRVPFPTITMGPDLRSEDSGCPTRTSGFHVRKKAGGRRMRGGDPAAPLRAWIGEARNELMLAVDGRTRCVVPAASVLTSRVLLLRPKSQSIREVATALSSPCGGPGERVCGGRSRGRGPDRPRADRGFRKWSCQIPRRSIPRRRCGGIVHRTGWSLASGPRCGGFDLVEVKIELIEVLEWGPQS